MKSPEEEDLISCEYKSLFYKFFSGAMRYPTDELAERISTEEFWDGMNELVSAAGCQSLEEYLQEKDKICNEVKDGKHALEVEYNRLFQLSQQFACPITASEYLPGESRQATAVAQLKGLYKAFGLKTRPSTEADHISVLLEFMSFLYAKEAHALNKGNVDESAECRKARSIVLEDFLGWLPIFVNTVKLNSQLKFYPWIASLLTEFLRTERETHLIAKEKDK